MEILKGLIGNADIKNTLGSAICNSEFLHTYIIEGAYGTGKHTVARLAAASIMCRNRGESMPCLRCNMCKKILGDNCADVRFFDAFKVDDVRKIKETLYDSPTECDYKVYVLCNAEKMNIKAQNALLISLEEPPKNVVFFLLCTDSTILLETIRSRAQILRTTPLDREQILSYISENIKGTMPSKDVLDEIILSSGGSLGYVIDMLDTSKSQGLTKDRERVKALVKGILANDASSVSAITPLFQLARDRLREILSLGLVALRDLAVIKKSKSAQLCFYTSLAEAQGISSKYSLKRILSAYARVERAIADTNSNSNVPSTLVSIITNSNKKGN
ncbi:MAG: hypothetical protein J6B29_02830 [Clostridia bacterium]|nr:hypothetical protein [Clostridia bacterium]